MSENQQNDEQLSLLGDEGKILPVPMAKNEAEGIQGVMAKDADPVVLRLTVKVAVVKAHINTGRSFTKNEMSVLINSLVEEVIRAYGTIRLGEIGLAIHKAAMGEYEKVYSLSLAFFVQSIRTYMSSDKRLHEGKLLMAKAAAFALPAHIPSPEELEANKKEIVINAFERFKKAKVYQDHGNYIFDALANYGVVNFTEEDKNLLWKQARTNVFRYYTRPTNSIDERNERKRVLKELQENKLHSYFWVEVKKIALNKFFADLVEVDTELSELIEA